MMNVSLSNLDSILRFIDLVVRSLREVVVLQRRPSIIEPGGGWKGRGLKGGSLMS